MTKEWNTKQKRIFRGAAAAAAVLMLAAVLFVGAGAAAETEIATADDFYQFVADVNASTEDTTYNAILTGDFTLDNKTIINPTVNVTVILDLNGHVITSTYVRSASILLKAKTTLEIYDNSGSTAVRPYDSVTVYDDNCKTGVTTAGGSIVGGGIIWQPAGLSADYQTAGNPKTDGDEAGYSKRAPVGKCIQVGTGAELYVHGGTFANFVGNVGGCIELVGTAKMVMDGGKITDCIGIYQGGAINLHGTSIFIMDDGEITHCSATYGGGVKVNSGTLFTMTGGTITDCSATKHGGGVYVNSGTLFTMTGGTITDCSATYGGGVVSFGSFTMTGGEITHCSATNSGGGVYVNSGTFTMTGGEITHCSATYGGGVYVNSGTFTMSGGRIAYCVSYTGPDDGQGGAMDLEGGITHISGTAVIEHCSANWGGAIHVINKAIAYIEGGTFRNNKAYQTGGALDVENGKCWVSGGIFENNTGNYGGAINVGYGTCSITGGIFRGNHDASGSNAIATEKRSVTLLPNLIIGGTVTLEGDQSFRLIDLPSGSRSFKIGTPTTIEATDFTSEPFTGSIKNFIIDNDDLDGRTLFTVNVTSSGQNASDVLGRIGLQDTDKWTLTANDTSDPKKIVIRLNKPVASSASVLFDGADNATAYVNITLTYDNDASSAAVEFWNGGSKINTSNVVTSCLTKGSTVGGFVVEGLSDNTEYTVKANLTMSGSAKYFVYVLGKFICSNPKITTHPQSAVYQKGAAAAVLQVTAAGTSLTYQWENSTDGTTFTAMPGKTFDNITPSTAELGTVYYRVNVTDTDSGKSVYSLTAEIEVYSTYSITYNPKEGSLPATGNPSQYSSNEAFALNDPVRQYYVGSWINAVTKEPVSVIYKGTTGNLTLNAAYTPREYYITYNNGGQTTNPATYNVTSGTITLTDASRAGYLFLGWYNNAAFTGAKVTSISSAAPKDIEVYGRWVQQITKVVTADSNVSFSSFEGTADPRTVGTQTVLTGIDGLTPGKNISFAKARPDIESSTLPSQSGYYTNVYSVFDIGYDGIMSGEAQITLNVTLAAGDSADSLHAMHNDGSGWTDLSGISKTQSGDKVTIVGNTSSFSPFAVVSYSEKPQPQHSSSRNDGTSIWLTATPTPVPTDAAPAAQPTQGVPSASPVKPTQTSASPAPFVGILAGLGAAAVFFGMRRK